MLLSAVQCAPLRLFDSEAFFVFPQCDGVQVAGNYFPCNAAAAIFDGAAQLTVLVDASHGVGSIRDGELELMVHRRLLYDDSRGVGEPLDETEFVNPYVGDNQGAKFGAGLVIRGRHLVTLEPPATAASIWRPLADRVFGKLVGTFASNTTAFKSAETSALARALPANVQIMTLQLLAPTKILLRLSHQFGIGEDPQLSTPVTVDLASLFSASAFQVVDAVQVSLTANQNVSAIEARNARALAMRVEGAEAAVVHPWRQQAPWRYSSGEPISLGPLEIKTFFLTIS